MNWDHLFEWHLSRVFAKQAREKVQRHILRKPAPVVRTDLGNIHLAYDDRGQLSLADVRPSGFLLKAQG